MLVHDVNKISFRFFKSTIIPCATAADVITTKLRVENEQAQIEKNNNDTRVVQTHVDLKKYKMGRLAITDKGLAVGLLQAGVSKQEMGLHCSLFLANSLYELIDFYTLSV